MFNNFIPKRIEFKSNPPLLEHPEVVPSKDSSGRVINTVVMKPSTNRSPFEGVHFSEELHSLRAKLNSGVSLQPVSLCVENDPAVLAGAAALMESQIEARLNELREEQPVEPSPEPSTEPSTEPSES